MQIHFIAIGGAVMHQLAIELQRNGHHITGSDDEIFEPAKGNLLLNRLLPAQEGWDTNKIHADLDAVILGMHAKADNPELLKAKALGLKIYSFPEYMYEFSKDKTRIVIAGSHGKTSTTSMIMHVLQHQGVRFDYLVGAKIEGFERSVGLSEAPIIIMEGDEYPASALEPRPKIHFYRPHISTLTGIEWDHINVFPTLEHYIEQFAIYLKSMEPGATLIYCDSDPTVKSLVAASGQHLTLIPYSALPSAIDQNTVHIQLDGKSYPVSVFGTHNLQNMHAALQVCLQLGVTKEDFFRHIQDFTGAAKRLEIIKENDNIVIFKDFAHAPSKVRATIEATTARYAQHKVIACLELHTYSSLNKAFHHQYKGVMDAVPAAAVFYSQHALELKRLPNLDAEEIRKDFGSEHIFVTNDHQALQSWISDEIQLSKQPVCLLMMSSGTYEGLDLTQFG